MSSATANLMMANVRTFLEVQSAFDECDPQIKAEVEEMLAICKHPDATEDEKERALWTIVEALFPSLASDILHEETTLRKSDPARVRSAELDREEAVFFERLNAAMKAKAFTQEMLANAAGVGQPAVSNLLSRACRPQRRTVLRLARALGVEPADLWPGISVSQTE